MPIREKIFWAIFLLVVGIAGSVMQGILTCDAYEPDLCTYGATLVTTIVATPIIAITTIVVAHKLLMTKRKK